MKLQRQTGRLSCDNKGRDWKKAAASEGTPKIANKPAEVSERQGRIPPIGYRGHMSLLTL